MLFINQIAAMAQAGQSSGADMADVLRSSGKIYVVVLVVGLVFLGLLIYAVFIDRKVTKIEREIRDLERKKE